MPVQVLERKLRLKRDPAIEALLASLGAKLVEIEAPFEPEGGAYAGPRASMTIMVTITTTATIITITATDHHHEHGHDHDHEHSTITITTIARPIKGG